jgi:signal transduction histidine kinase
MLELNRASASLLGIERSRVQRKPLAAFIDQDSSRELRAALLRLGRMEAVKDLTLRLRPRDGGEVPVSVRAAHMPAHDGEEARVIWTFRNQSDLQSLDVARRDLAREKESREVAEARSEQARYIVHAAAELGADDDPNRVSARAARLAGRFGDYATVEIFDEDGGLTVRGAYHRANERNPQLQKWIGARLLEAPEGSELARFLESAGSIFVTPGEALPELLHYAVERLPEPLLPISVAVVPLTLQGKVAGVLRVMATSASGAEQLRAWVYLLEAFGSYIGMALANARLLQEADRRRLAAAESSRGRSRAMAGLSHELRTPLHSILGYTELLLEGVAEPLGEKATRFVKAIRGSALHQAELVDDILSLARPGRTRRFTPASLVVEDVVAECVTMVMSGHGRTESGFSPRCRRTRASSRTAPSCRRSSSTCSGTRSSSRITGKSPCPSSARATRSPSRSGTPVSASARRSCRTSSSHSGRGPPGSCAAEPKAPGSGCRSSAGSSTSWAVR